MRSAADVLQVDVHSVSLVMETEQQMADKDFYIIRDLVNKHLSPLYIGANLRSSLSNEQAI